MKIKSFLIASIALGSGIQGSAQEYKIKSFSEVPPESIKTDETGAKYYVDEKNKARIYEMENEMVVVMDEMILRAKPRFNNQLDKNYYAFLNKKLARVYPLFLTALQQYRTLEQETANMDKSLKKSIIRQKQGVLAAEYEAKLKDLTTTEGKVFSKLMSRATGQSVYEIIKDLKGSWSAFWWNVKGNIAEIDLKDGYDPHNDRTDLYLESLLQESWNRGALPKYPGADSFKK